MRVCEALVATIVLVFLKLQNGALQSPQIDFGSSQLVVNRTVYAGVIVSDKKSIINTIYSMQNNVSTTIDRLLDKRRESVKALVEQLPLSVLQWAPINTKPCPHYGHSSHGRYERGTGLAHLQIWLEFLFFDLDVIDAMNRPTPEYITSNSYSSVSGVFTAYPNRSLYKNGIPFLDDDVMLIFEDSALVVPFQTEKGTAPANESVGKEYLQKNLVEALKNISTDILSLGNPVLMSNASSLDGVHRLFMNNNLHHQDDSRPVLAHRRLRQEERASSSRGNLYKSSNTKQHKDEAKSNTYPASSSPFPFRNRQLQSHLSNGAAHEHPQSPNTATASAAASGAGAGTGTDKKSATVFAYALTRLGARKLVRCYDACGRSLQEQISHCAEHGLVTHSHASTPLFELAHDA
jgi:hypothetical protein